MGKARDLADRHTRMAICSSSNVANGGFAANTFEAVPFATDVVDSASAFTGEASTDTNNGGVFTVPADGTYFIAVNQSVTCTTTSRLTQARLRLMLNTTGDIPNDGGSEIQGTDVGTLLPDDATNGSATEFNCYTQCLQTFSAGNKIYVQMLGNIGAGALRAGDGNFIAIQVN
tara:strand:+ start:13 stop:531 length:519 start_codon:yes stop_codon:yes gene_type:complete